MKIGIEVEGRLRGISTLFIDAKEIPDAWRYLEVAKDAEHLKHVYISDRGNVLSYFGVAAAFPDRLVTMEVTVIQEGLKPSNLVLMLYVPGYEQVKNLRSTDMVKFEKDQNVLCFEINQGVRTDPHEFLDDIPV